MSGLKKTKEDKMIARVFKNAFEDSDKVQETLKETYARIAKKNLDKISVGESGGGLVTCYTNIKAEVIKLDIQPELFEEAPEAVSGLIISAVNTALLRAKEAKEEIFMQVAEELTGETFEDDEGAYRE